MPRAGAGGFPRKPLLKTEMTVPETGSALICETAL